MERTISAAWVRGIRELLTATGLDAYAVFKEAGLDILQLNNAEARIAPEKVSRLWELAVQHSGNPAISVLFADNPKPALFDAVGFVMMSGANLRAGLERLSTYLRIVTDAATMTLTEGPQTYTVTIELFGGGRPVPRQRIEFVLVSIVGFCRWISGRDMRPLAVDLASPEPDDPQPYRDAFRCPVHFGASAYRMHFSLADVTAPLPTSNPVLAAMHDQVAGETLNRLNNNRLSFKTRELIIRHLPDGEPLRADIAKELLVSERTLQRRLEEEGTTFQLVDDTRRELTEVYLNQHHLSLTEVAYLVGFVNHSAFFRACKRWFDMSPGEYRSSQVQNPHNGK